MSARRLAPHVTVALRVKIAAVVVALSVIPSVSLQAMPAGVCTTNRLNAGLTLGATTAAAAVATSLELQGMQRESSWHMASEPNRKAVFVDPSSHLHGLGSYYLAKSATSSFIRSSCSDSVTLRLVRRAALKGAAVSITLGAIKEVADGWYNGFSTTDLTVDALGAGFALAQSYVAPLRHVTPSMTVSPAALRNGGLRQAAFDYGNQTLWLSANVHEMLPSSVASAWPKAIRLSAGRRAKSGGVDNAFIVGLDLDAAHLPGNNPAWTRVKNALHNVRLPGPAIVMGQNGTSMVGLYW
jgi:hypothetical protein